MKRTLLAALLVPALLATSSVIAAEAGAGSLPPSTPEQRAKVVSMVLSLETDPLASGAKGTRQALLAWLIGVPDISVKVCLYLLGSFHEVKRYPYDAEIGLQPEFAEAAFMIEHPDQASDELAVFTAGVESALRVYETILKTKPNARLKVLDDLVVLRDQGKLSAHVAQAAEKCK